MRKGVPESLRHTLVFPKSWKSYVEGEGYSAEVPKGLRGFQNHSCERRGSVFWWGGSEGKDQKNEKKTDKAIALGIKKEKHTDAETLNKRNPYWCGGMRVRQIHIKSEEERINTS